MRKEEEAMMEKGDIIVDNELEEVEAVKESVETEEVTEEDSAEIIEEQETVKVEAIAEKLKEELQEKENKYLRVLADYENLKRRSALDQEALKKYRAQAVLTNLIPVLDNFERALQVKTESEETKSVIDGMDMIYRSLLDALKAEGLVEIEALNTEFDPNFHQAIMTESKDDVDAGIVLEEMQKGYMLKDRVLRPTMVKVSE